MRDINYYKERYQVMHSKKMEFREKLEDVNRYVRQEGNLFEEAEEVDEEFRVYEATAPNAARKQASMLKGILWPSASKAFKLKLIEKISDTKENKDWIEKASGKLAKKMDSPQTGCSDAIDENLYEQITLGSAATFISEDDTHTIKYNTWGLGKFVFDEGANGHVNTVYYYDKLTVKVIVETYGIDKVSDNISSAYNANKLHEKHMIVQAIEPKFENGKETFEYDSVHFEFDSEHILKKSKFNELPVPVSRFYKNADTILGLSPSIEIMALIKEINRKVELREYLEESEIQPPLGFISTAFGGEYLDISPRALNPFNEILTANSPVFRIIPQVNLNISDETIVRMKDQITEAYSLDRLVDFNNQTQMTLGEAQIRNQIRGQSANTILSRQTQFFTHLIERSFNINYRAGEFGVIRGSKEEDLLIKQGKEPEYIPDEIAEVIQSGEDFYEIEYISPAARMKSAEELNGLVQSITYALQLAQAKPEILDWINIEEVIKIVFELTGSPLKALKAKDAVEEIQKARAEAQAKQQEQIEASNQATLEKQQQEVLSGQ